MTVPAPIVVGLSVALAGWALPPLLKSKRQKVRPENCEGACGTPGRTQSIS